MTTPQELTLTYVHFSFFHGGKTNRLIDLLAEKMEKECGLEPGDIFKALTLAKTANNTKDTKYVNKTGFFLLHDDKELYCASAMDYSTLVTRWVPPKHRRKGYATLMLKAVEAAFRQYTTLPIWVISYERMATINTRAGWVKNPDINTDRRTGELDLTKPEQHDWFPEWNKDAYYAARNQTPEWKARWWAEWKHFLETQGGPVNLNLKVKF